VAAAIGDLVNADRDKACQTPFVEVLGDDTLNDPPDRVPADSQQAGDRCLRHLLRQPGDDVLKVARVVRVGPGPRHRVVAHTTVGTAQPAQLTLDHAAAGAKVEMTPPLNAAIVDLELPTSLTALRADPPPAAQPNRHDHPLDAERHVDHRRPRQAKHPVECGLDAHALLPCRPLSFITQQPSSRTAARPSRSAQPPNETSAANRLLTRPNSRPRHPQTDRRPSCPWSTGTA
jgi:hypothetical protein